MTLAVTDHAVDRFVARVRPDLGPADARAELLRLAQMAVPTRRRTLNKDGQVYVVERDDGVKVSLVVRDGVVVTVLALGTHEDAGPEIDPELLDESAETREACRRMLENDLTPAERDRRQAARDLLAKWRGGWEFSQKALRRAHEALEMRYDGRVKP